MVNLKLDADDDLDLSTGNLELVSGTDEVVQKLRTRLRFVLGEWFLDQRQGLPYYQQILVKNPNLVVIQGIFREAILETPRVDSLVGALELDFTTSTRTLAVSFSVLLTSGETIDFNEELLIGD